MSDPPGSEALAQLLRELPGSIPIEQIDRLWIFSPREIGSKESGLLVLSLLVPGPETGREGQRRVVTLRYEAERGRGGVRRTDTLADQGSAPADRVQRVIDGVLRRLGDESEDPVAREVRGDPARWEDLLASVGRGSVDPAGGE